jgi:hypothetical protein
MVQISVSVYNVLCYDEDMVGDDCIYVWDVAFFLAGFLAIINLILQSNSVYIALL